VSDLDGRLALVTGATSGIGKAVALALAAEGAHVVVHGRDTTRLRAVADRIRAAGGAADAVAADLAGGPEAARQLAAEASTAGNGRIDILVNNAAVLIPGQSMLDVTDAEITAALTVNVGAVVALTASVVPAMRAAGAGVIVNVGSINGFVGMAQAALYGATKAALHSLTKSWAAELASHGIRVNAVAPGPTVTEENSPYAERLHALTAGYPDQRPATAAEVADAVLFLAGSRAAHIHGAILPVDGGAQVI
jgi:NAD(P)-dependent dehydrogenase (short-subunit alcohol dehydrogenase family)